MGSFRNQYYAVILCSMPGNGDASCINMYIQEVHIQIYVYIYNIYIHKYIYIWYFLFVNARFFVRMFAPHLESRQSPHRLFRNTTCWSNRSFSKGRSVIRHRHFFNPRLKSE